jgi:hypothetical protein
MSPQSTVPVEPLSAEEERQIREGLAGIPSPDIPEPMSAVEAGRRLWADRCKRLLATLDAARASQPITATNREDEAAVEDAIVALAVARLWLVGEYATRDRDEFNAGGWRHLVDRVGPALSGKPGWMHSARTYRLRGEQLDAHRATLSKATPSSDSALDVRAFAEDLIAEIGSMMSVSSWSKIETEARRSAYNDVLAVISDRLAALPVREDSQPITATDIDAITQADAAASLVHDYIWQKPVLSGTTPPSQDQASDAIWTIHNVLRPLLAALPVREDGPTSETP